MGSLITGFIKKRGCPGRKIIALTPFPEQRRLVKPSGKFSSSAWCLQSVLTFIGLFLVLFYKDLPTKRKKKKKEKLSWICVRCMLRNGQSKIQQFSNNSLNVHLPLSRAITVFSEKMNGRKEIAFIGYVRSKISEDNSCFNPLCYVI